jgi:uncharacterized iron-regulated membrane protein
VVRSIRFIHRWLGLISGLVVFILGVTGCLLAFEQEIRGLTEPYRNVKAREQPYRLPSELKAVAAKHLQSGLALGIEYPGRGKAAVAAYYDETHYELVFLDPYTGAFLKHKNMNRDFFRIVLDGHYYLWLPHKIGQPVAASATLVFLVLLISGIALWWPRNKAAIRQRFRLKWNTSWKRKNYDLHAVLGFYMSWVALFIVITGLVFGFEWAAKTVYWVSSGGQAMVTHEHPVSDSSKQASIKNMADHLWQKHLPAVNPSESIAVYFANRPSDPVEVIINHRPGTYYKTDYYHYDQYTGKHLNAKGSWDGKFSEASIADKIARMNYDIHVGAILGFAGKLLAFFASLVAASLPITGFLIWRSRNRKKRNEEIS